MRGGQDENRNGYKSAARLHEWSSRGLQQLQLRGVGLTDRGIASQFDGLADLDNRVSSLAEICQSNSEFIVVGRLLVIQLNRMSEGVDGVSIASNIQIRESQPEPDI